MDDKRQKVALFRYTLVQQVADIELTPRQRGALIRAVAARAHLLPDGSQVRVSAVSLWRWLRAWRRGGYQALLPQQHRPPNRTPERVLEMAASLKREAPARTATQVARVLDEAGLGKVSARTVRRHLARTGLNVRPDGSPPPVLGRFEAGAFGELWTGDGTEGPVVAGRRAILCAFIDDHSRYVTGWRWGTAEDTVQLERALRRGLTAHGLPKAAFVDNGSAFISGPFHRTLAVLGIKIIHSTKGHKESRGKIERFFETVKGQFLVELAARGGAEDLAELNELFGGWLEGVYHTTEHSETGATPRARRMKAAELRRPSPDELREAFLWEEQRLVTKTATVSLEGSEYEVDASLVGHKVCLLFDPFDMTDIEVRYQDQPRGKAVPLRIGRHTHPKARPEAMPPPQPSGIDYLAMVRERVRGEERARLGAISYVRLQQDAGLSGDGETPPSTPDQEENPS